LFSLHTFVTVIAVIAVALQGLSLYLVLFGPDLPYRVKHPPTVPLDSDYFRSLIATLTEAEIRSGNRVDVLTDGPCFYEEELQGISRAEKTINLEAYIFHRGEVSRRYVDALAERARAGVKVTLVLDYIGSFSTFRSYFRQLLDAGGRLEWYHSLRPDLLLQINNRTHRELLIVDGRVAFIGGAGIADQWYKDGVKGRRWRDTVLRVEGPAVAALQSVFAQNWLRVSGEILTGEDYFQFGSGRDGSLALTVDSTPAAGSTQARILFQLLIASAKKCVYITSPYFLPDRSARQEIIRAARERNVEVKILTPGDNNDQKLTRASSREVYGTLLKHGIQIFEFKPAMIHVKALMVDDCWAVVGSTNFDYRSFDINDEVNLAILDEAVTKRLAKDFENDLSRSTQITYEDWRTKRRFRIADRFFSLLERLE
jgi:cardiolipin synthase A/B